LLQQQDKKEWQELLARSHKLEAPFNAQIKENEELTAAMKKLKLEIDELKRTINMLKTITDG